MLQCVVLAVVGLCLFVFYGVNRVKLGRFGPIVVAWGIIDFIGGIAGVLTIYINSR